VWLRRKFLVLEMFGLAIGVSGRNFTTRQATVTSELQELRTTTK